MKKLLPTLGFLILTTIGFSQKKSELLAQIEDLKTEKSGVEQELAKAKREISSSKATAETFESENASLRDANATLLQNLSSFSELSKKNSENVNATLAALSRKEKQLSGISDMIASSDSTSIVLLTRIKQTMGENANPNISDGAVVLSKGLTTLFGSDTGTELTEEGKSWLTQIAKVLLASPNLKAEVEGLNMTGEFGVTYDQAATVTKELVVTLGIPSSSVGISAKDGNFKEGIAISFSPDYKGFYTKAKESVKTN
ncbi:hypothetical protein [Flagellimonas eckloniae]|uniref:OmpA family protein n=1 Tax=Flagellimonas eckloniae TaxID=346185 RepID=A0A0Q1BWM0_9FLAO|nr:hypothetical protein [Allomuricauda eckloniae]KQC29006.1 hypothetical protein AAY42_03165 [Allomuricauda eckloniae]